MRVFVYFNLHRKCWSIKALEGPSKGRVIGHADYVDLACVEWKVSEAGRQRVIREKKKNVHAGAIGTTAYNLLADRTSEVLIKHHAITNDARAALEVKP